MILDLLSKDVREYMEQNGLFFSDFEKAALIHHSHLPFSKRMERLQRLAEETKDEALKREILENLAYDRQDLDAFRDNTEGYVYAAAYLGSNDYHYTICGYFAAMDTAYAHGITLECKFLIEKQFIIGFRGQRSKAFREYSNPYISGGLNISDCVEEYDGIGHPVAVARYSENGTLEFFYSDETDRSDEEVITRRFDPSRYERSFIRVPNLFQRGDIVKIVGHEGHGIVCTGQKEWRELLERVETGEQGYADFHSATVDVDFFGVDGCFSHRCICPVFLERYEPKEGDDRELLLAGQKVMGDRGSFTDSARYLRLSDDYKKLKREMRK